MRIVRNIKVGLSCIAIIFIAGIAIFFYAKIKDCVYINICGDSLPLKIRYTWRYPTNDAEYLFVPNVRLLFVSKYNNRSTLLFLREQSTLLYLPEGLKPIGQVQQYISDDRGITLQNVDFPLLWQSDIKSNSARLVSHVDHQTIYECSYKCKAGFPLSTDGGKTWTHVFPILSNGDAINEIQLMDTGMHLASRVYARIWMDTNKIPGINFEDVYRDSYEYRIGVSDDYGRHFKLLPPGIMMLVESRKNQLIRYGLLVSSDFNISYNVSSMKGTVVEDIRCLALSKDEGETWEVMEGSRDIVLRPIYRRRTNPEDMRSWKQYQDDEEWLMGGLITQIESDPKYSGYVYVLTSAGLFFSRDNGKTFRYANLAHGLFDSIDRIAVDPLDGRYIYATVGMKEFYRSSDYGCTWTQMPLPPFPK